MASIIGKDIPVESQFMKDYWRFRKEFYIPEQDDDYWRSLDEAANKLVYEYDPEVIKNPNKKSYFKEIVLACVSEIESRFRKEAIRK